jgi:hypothetical protein
VTGDGTVSLGKKGNPMTGEKSTMDGLGELARVARKNDPVLRLDGTKRKRKKERKNYCSLLFLTTFSFFVKFFHVFFFFEINKFFPPI